MRVNYVLLFVTVLTGLLEAKARRCRGSCHGAFTPVCGRDPRLGYNTFCTMEALQKCNTDNKGYNFTKIANGPCYPSVREWRNQSSVAEQETVKPGGMAARSPYLKVPDPEVFHNQVVETV